MRLPLLLLALLTFTGLASADIPAPRPIQFTVTGLDSFKAHEFLYSLQQGSSDGTPQKLEGSRLYSAESNVHLYVRKPDGTPHRFAILRYDYHGHHYTVRVKGIKPDGAALWVEYEIDTKPANAAGRTPVVHRAWSPTQRALPYLLLAGLCASALWLRRPKSPTARPPH